MSWNYRIVRYANGTGYGLHEVHYDENGEPWAMTEERVDFCCEIEEGPNGIEESIVSALADIRGQPILDEPKTWPGKPPQGDDDS